MLIPANPNTELEPDYGKIWINLVAAFKNHMSGCTLPVPFQSWGWSGNKAEYARTFSEVWGPGKSTSCLRYVLRAKQNEP